MADFSSAFRGCVPLHAQTKSVVVEEIVARVNNEIITREDLAHARDSLRERSAGGLPELHSGTGAGRKWRPRTRTCFAI